MSILKSIYKVRNRDSQIYDTLHPETEHSQVVDFGQGILSHLQSNVLASAISAMTSDSLFAKMMKLVLDASGVKYSMQQNGYICLGEFFGNLIIQWGNRLIYSADEITSFAVNFNETYAVGAVHSTSTESDYKAFAIYDVTNKNFKVTTSTYQIGVRYIAIGR